MKSEPTITDLDLHAYADEQLSPARRAEVEDYLAHHPEAMAQIDAIRQLDQALHTLFDPVLAEPIPATIRLPWIKKRMLLRAAAAVAWIGLGTVLGWSLNSLVELGSASPMEAQLVRPAAFAHVIYTAEVLHPVEIGAEDEQHLIEWLSKRLHTPIRAPDLAASGYRLVGGRLLPSTDRMAAQFMYEDALGRRVTLYMRRGAWDNSATAFRYSQNRGVGVFYWIDGPLGYALSAELEKAELLKLAVLIHPQVEP